MLRRVRVRKTELLKTVTENRGKHEAVLSEAMEGYRQRLIKILSPLLEDLKAGKEISPLPKLKRPESHLTDYDRVLKMLHMSEDEVLELTDEEFSRFVMDDWDWGREWQRTASLYASR